MFNGQVVAESDETQVVEGNHYFPPHSVRAEFLQPSDHHTTCPWKGEASYRDVVVGGEVAKNGAWFYPQTYEKAKAFEGWYAFWKGVEVEA